MTAFRIVRAVSGSSSSNWSMLTGSWSMRAFAGGEKAETSMEEVSSSREKVRKKAAVLGGLYLRKGEIVVRERFECWTKLTQVFTYCSFGRRG